MATKKASAKKKPPAKKTVASKNSPRKTAPQSTRKTPSKSKSGGTLQNIARSIGSTLGTITKKTSKAVDAAKEALPGPLRGEF